MEQQHLPGMKIFTHYVVTLQSKRGRKGHDGKPITMASYNITSSSPEAAIRCAKRYCFCLTGRIFASVRPATAYDLGAR